MQAVDAPMQFSADAVMGYLTGAFSIHLLASGAPIREHKPALRQAATG
jgi:hypothetical protein